MTTFYCAVCRLSKPIEERDLSRNKPIRCLKCKKQAEERTHTVKPQKAQFNKYTPVVMKNS